jgi:hypothetical protein
MLNKVTSTMVDGGGAKGEQVTAIQETWIWDRKLIRASHAGG